MGHQAKFVDGRAGAKPGNQRVGVCRPKTQPIHAGIELEPDYGTAAARRLEQFHLFRAVHDHFEAVVKRLIQFVVSQDAGQQHDRLVDARVTQNNRLGQSRHGESIGIGKTARDGGHAVTVSIGLDDSHDPGAGRRGANHFEIVLEGAEPDQCPCAEGHG